jgi:chromosome segregation ATPase
MVESNGHESDMEQLLKEKDLKIAALERIKQRQDEEIADLRNELGASDIHHKEELYWLRLELDNLRREKEDVEDRIDTLYRDLKEMEGDEDMPTEISTDPEYVRSLQAQVSKYVRTLGILEQQTNMVKQSCDEIVKSLKEEIADVMDDKVRMEMDLLNQLASLDSDKRELEMEFEEQVKLRDEKIANLKQGIGVVGDGGKAGGNEEDVRNEIADLKAARKKLEEDLEAERTESDDAIARLEEANADLEQQIESMTSDLEVMRQGAAAEAVQVLDALTRDRQETLTTLERVALIWEKADDSIQGLEDVMDELRPHDEDDVHGDRERLLSTLETASLVHGQIKVSLLLIELKLRNQLSSLKNDKLRMGSGAIPDQNLTERMQEIQQEALTALDQVEDSLTDQIKGLETLTREETGNVKDTLTERTEELRNMQSQHRKLEAEIKRVRAEEERRRNREDEEGSSSNGTSVSRAVLERLQSEVLTVVERVKEKNELIGRLQTSIDEHKVREAALKKELKRMMKRSRGAE